MDVKAGSGVLKKLQKKISEILTNLQANNFYCTKKKFFVKSIKISPRSGKEYKVAALTGIKTNNKVRRIL
jgi:hypothetical protein